MADSITSGGIYFPPNAYCHPFLAFNVISISSLNAAAFVGRIFIADRSTSKVVSSAGGAIEWRQGAGSVSASAIYAIGIQDLGASGPDGAFDVSTTVTGTVAFASNSWRSTAMTSGSKTISNGGTYCVVFDQVTSVGAGVLGISAMANSAGRSGNFAGTVTAGGINKANALTPNCLIKCDDGTLAWFADSFALSNTTNISVSSGGANTEYGMRFTLPWTSEVDALRSTFIPAAGASAGQSQLILYASPDGVPVTVASVTIQAEIQSTVLGTTVLAPLESPVTLTASVTYLLAMRSVSVSAFTITTLNFADAAYKIVHPAGGSLALGARSADPNAFSMDETSFPSGFQVRISKITPTTTTVTTTTTTTITTTIASGGSILVHPGLTGGFRG